MKVISAQKEAYEEIRATLQKKKKEIEAKLNSFKKHPYLQTNELKTQIGSAFQSISRDLDQIERNHPDYLLSDPVHERLTEILAMKVGEDFSDDDLQKTYREGKKRYEEKIPPGYMDQREKKDQGNNSLYGDLLVWKQTIHHAREVSRSIVFVTDDLKEDWWYKFKGKTIGPRPELIKEFRDETSQQISLYKADRFLEFANKALAQNTAQGAIDEVRKLRIEDERDFLLSVEDTESAGSLNHPGFSGGFLP